MDTTSGYLSPHQVPTIGFLTSDLFGIYQFSVVSGAVDCAREQGANLICFAGGEVNSPYSYHHIRNILHELISPKNVDGLILLSSILGNFIGKTGVEALSKKFDPLPMVSISLPLPSIPSLLVDNKAGMRAAVDHLIEVHKYQRILFLQGPVGSEEAEQRYEAYLEALAAHGITFDPALVLRGNFHILHTTRLIHKFLSQGIPFDAIVAANDETAIAAMQVLEARNIRVPDDVAVVGFDDIEEAGATTAPLTTVRQPLYELGYGAVELLLKRLQNQPVAEQTILTTRLVTRQSCGCLPNAVVYSDVEEVKPSEVTLETLLRVHQHEITSAMIEAMGIAGRGIDIRDIEELLQAFTDEFTGERPNTFLTALDRIARTLVLQGEDPTSLHNVVSTMRRCVLPALLHSHTAVVHIDDLWQRSQVLITQVAQRAQLHRVVQIRHRPRIISEMVRDMVNSPTLDDLLEVAADHLPHLGIEAFYLSLYEGPTFPSEWSRLILAYDRNGRVALEPGGKRFPTIQLVPHEVLASERMSHLLVDVLHYKEEQMGLVAIGINHDHILLEEEISELLSSILKALRTSEEHKRVEADLRQLNQLKTEFISTAAHELRTPLTSIQGFSEILLNRDLDQTRQKRYLTMINHESVQLTSIINDLLDVSRLESKRHLALSLASVNMTELIATVAATLNETFSPHPIDLGGLSPCPQVMGDHFRLSQVVSNLLHNAIKYSPNGGAVMVRSDVVGKQLQISVQDHGIGMTPEQQSHLFEKFYRADASNTAIGGTGLGLSISKMIVELHGGKIWADSTYGLGSTFYFTLPLSS